MSDLCDIFMDDLHKKSIKSNCWRDQIFDHFIFLIVTGGSFSPFDVLSHRLIVYKYVCVCVNSVSFIDFC